LFFFLILGILNICQKELINLKNFVGRENMAFARGLKLVVEEEFLKEED